MLPDFWRAVQRATYQIACRGVLDTPPLKTDDKPIKILSQLCHRDVIPYLVAAKSLYRYLGRGGFVILSDGSLSRQDRAIVDEHLDKPEWLDVGKVNTGPCPRGGCWERLLSISESLASNYIIQMDADTITVGAIPEVVECCLRNVSFTLGTTSGRRIVSTANAAQFARDHLGDVTHVQAESERLLDRLPASEHQCYVRGCAGFAGFARGSLSREAVEEFSIRMHEMLGSRWSNWGSEQVTSNFLIANTPGAIVLPLERYSSYEPTEDHGAKQFFHFFGTYRYSGGLYRALSRKAITELGVKPLEPCAG